MMNSSHEYRLREAFDNNPMFQEVDSVTYQPNVPISFGNNLKQDDLIGALLYHNSVSNYSNNRKKKAIESKRCLFMLRL